MMAARLRALACFMAFSMLAAPAAAQWCDFDVSVYADGVAGNYDANGNAELFYWGSGYDYSDCAFACGHGYALDVQVERKPEQTVVASMSYAVLGSSLAMILSSSPAESQQSRPTPVVESQLHVNPAPPPPTVPEMVALADAVIIGRYIPGARFTESEQVNDIPTLPMTMHPFEVVAVVRPFLRLPVPGETIEIKMYGGQRHHGTHIERISVPGQRQLLVGRLYVIFLRWHERRQMFELPWSAMSIYDVTSDRVGSLFEYDRRHTGRPAGEFLSEMGLRDWVPPEPTR